MSAGEQQAATRYGRRLPPTALPHGSAMDVCRPYSPSPATLLTASSLSLGDPNARPPTPQRTPTAVLSSPLLQTPKQNPSHFDETSGWTPRFAEEYSVFNSTPGNLRGTSSSGSGAFNLDFAPLSPEPPSTGKKRPLSAEGVALQIATHANHFTADPTNLAPVDAARRLPSSPDPLTLTHKDAAAAGTSNVTPKAQQVQLQQQQQGGQRLAKKSRGSSVAAAATAKSPFSAHRQTQTATPPPSSRGGRKLAPKPQTDNTMQNQGFPQPDFSSAQPPPPPPQLNTAFVTGNPEDVFGYPMGPATAPPVTGPRPFWGFDMDTTGMDTGGMAIDVDLSAAGADLFQTPTQSHSQRPMSSMEWGSANFQQTPSQQPPPPPQGQLQGQGAQQDQSTLRGGRPLAPKTTAMSTPRMVESPNQNFAFHSFQMMDNPFNTSPGGVDPGLLFSQTTPSVSMDSNAMVMSMSMSMATPSRPTSSAPAAMAQTTAGMNIEPVAPTAPMSAGNNFQRSGSQGQAQGQQRKLDRAPAISPIKNQVGRPNLSRSFSESARGGKRTVGGGRNALPALAPARLVTVHQPNLPPPPPPPPSQSNNRPQTQGGRSGGRSSPLKSSHHRLSSLTSIPENAANIPSRSRSAKRTSVKFVIDENGRARAETIVDEDEDPEPAPLSSSSSQQSIKRNSWAGPLPVPGPVPVSAPMPDSDEEYSSSSDDEPIIIPSRNTSFSYPDPPKNSSLGNSRPPTASTILSQTLMRHRSISDRQSSSFRGNSQMEPDTADAMDIDPPQQPPQPQPQAQAQAQAQRPSTGGSLGDAAAELRKVMQAGNPRRPSSGQQQPPPALLGGGGGSSGHRQRFTPGQRSSSSTISEASLPSTSPTQGREQSQIRCVCNRPDAGEGAFLIKWYVYSTLLSSFALSFLFSFFPYFYL